MLIYFVNFFCICLLKFFCNIIIFYVSVYVVYMFYFKNRKFKNIYIYICKYKVWGDLYCVLVSFNLNLNFFVMYKFK